MSDSPNERTSSSMNVTGPMMCPCHETKRFSRRDLQNANNLEVLNEYVTCLTKKPYMKTNSF